MADEESEGKKGATRLPWGMSEKELKPNSVQSLPKSTLEAFSIGMTNPALKKNVFQKSKEEKDKKKKKEDEETAKVLEEFVNTFEESSKAKMTFVRGAVINPDKDTKAVAGTLYQPSGALKSKPALKSEMKISAASMIKPTKKEKEKKKSVLEMFGDELKRIQDERKERQAQRKSGDVPPEEEEKEMSTADPQGDDYSKPPGPDKEPLTTNLYIGNISPKMNEEMLCQHFGKFGALASVKIMWPRTEEERSRNRNCGFVAFMRRKDAEKALDAMKGSTILGHEVEIGWGKVVPLPPTPFYVAPDHAEERSSFLPDPPSGFPFNARPMRRSRSSGRGSYNNMPPPDAAGGGGEDPSSYDDDPARQSFDERLYNSIIKVVIPSDKEVLHLIHRMIEFIIREGPMFEAMIMNKEMGNQKFRFLFDNQSSEHVYYRWKLFSILQGDSPETWKTDEFRMFEDGSLWRPPPLKNLRGKVHPPIMEIVKRGQLPHENRNYLEDMLRNVTMERPKIRDSMIWCMEHAESSDEIVECITESLTIMETPLTLKIARLYLLTDILQNCNAHVSCAARYRRGFESKLLPIMEHFHDVMRKIESRMRAESFKRRVLRCLQSWDQLTVYHFNYVDKLREQFIGKTQEEMEKKRAFETVAALMSLRDDTTAPVASGRPLSSVVDDEEKPIDFSGGQIAYDMDEDIDGDPLPDPDVDGIPLDDDGEDIDGMPMEEDVMQLGFPSKAPLHPTPAPAPPSSLVQSKWELVDYGQGSSSSEEEDNRNNISATTGTTLATGTVRATGIAGTTAVDISEDSEEKRQQLREVEVKVIELMEALESSGSYSQQEIHDRTSRFREKLIKEVNEGKYGGSSSPDVTTTSSSRTGTGSTAATSSSTSSKRREKDSDSHKGTTKDSSHKSRRQSSRDDSSPTRDHSRSPTSRKRKHSSPSSSSSKRRSHSKDKHKSSKHKSPRGRSRSRSPRPKHKSRSPHSSSRKERHRSRSNSPSSHKSKKSSRR